MVWMKLCDVISSIIRKRMEIEYVCVGDIFDTKYEYVSDALAKVQTDVQEHLEMGYVLQGGVSICRVEENFCVVQTMTRPITERRVYDYGCYSD